jgi:hypothetical protein
MVFATFNIVATGAGTGNASLNISSLFTTTSSDSVAGSIIVSDIGGSVSSTVVSPKGTILSGANNVSINATIVISGVSGSTTYRQVTGTDLGSTFQLLGTLQYISAN